MALDILALRLEYIIGSLVAAEEPPFKYARHSDVFLLKAEYRRHQSIQFGQQHYCVLKSASGHM
jgi:hypothetical protein